MIMSRNHLTRGTITLRVTERAVACEKMAKIIVVEDDTEIREALVDVLVHEKHTVDALGNGADAWESLQRFQYDLVILDWGLPGLDGLEVLKRFRGNGGGTPVLFLTGRNTVDEKLTGLDSGADDYLPKPYDMREFRARVSALLRRPKELTSDIVRWSDIELDGKAFRCLRRGEEIRLLPKEFALLDFLIRNRNLVFTPDQLVDKLWAGDTEVSVDAIRQCVKRLRTKIDVSDRPSYITTVVGVGYKVESD